MNDTSLKAWIFWAVLLFALTLSADYFFLHFLFNHETNVPSQQEQVDATTTRPQDISSIPELANASPTGDGNFLEVLKQCAPEVAAQAIATPEALVEYLQKSVGAKKEDITLESYHLTLPNGSLRRVQRLIADNSNSKEKREIKLFSVNPEGKAEPMKIDQGQTLETLLEQGKLTLQEVKSELELRDGSQVFLEKHDNRVFEVQYNNQGKVLSCRYSQCQCAS